MAKKNKFKTCNKGYSCGAGCINVKFQCRKEYPEGVSVSIDGTRKVIIGKIQAKKKDNYLSSLEDQLSKETDTFKKEDIQSKINRAKLADEIPEDKKEEFLKELKDYEKVRDEFSLTRDRKLFGKLKDHQNKLNTLYHEEPLTPRDITSNKRTDVSNLVPETLPRGGADPTTKKFMDEAEMLVQVKSENLPGILNDGGFRSITDPDIKDKSIGAWDEDVYFTARKNIENKVLDVPPEQTDRPVYGYMEHPDRAKSSSRSLKSYGDVQLVLKPETKDRSTYTIGDSLDRGGDFLSTLKASPVNDPQSLVAGEESGKTAKAFREPGKFSGANKQVSYVETQIRGGVKTSDIQEARIPTSLRGSNLEKQLLDNGVKVSYIKEGLVN